MNHFKLKETVYIFSNESLQKILNAIHENKGSVLFLIRYEKYFIIKVKASIYVKLEREGEAITYQKAGTGATH